MKPQVIRVGKQSPSLLFKKSVCLFIYLFIYLFIMFGSAGSLLL